MAVGDLGGGGGADCLLPAAVLARGPLLALADRGHQVAAHAVLDAGCAHAQLVAERSIIAGYGY